MTCQYDRHNEWQPEDDWYETSCGHDIDWMEITEWVHCPYCGKEIEYRGETATPRHLVRVH